MSHNCEYVRKHYQVPAQICRRVIVYGKPGVIPADRGHYIGVLLDEDPKKRISNYHPTHEMQYGEMAETLRLKEWLVLPFKHNWDDLDRNREARRPGKSLGGHSRPGQIQGLRAASGLLPQHQGDASLQSPARLIVFRRCPSA